MVPCGEAKSNAEVVRLLAARLGLDDDIFRLRDAELIDLALQASPATQAGITRSYLESHHVARVGPPKGHAPFADGHFPTPSGKFEFVSADLARAGHGPLPIYVPPAESAETDAALAQRFPLRLLTRKRHHSINASARNIGDHDLVQVWNDRGAVTYRAVLSDRVMPGTVAAPFGPWIGQGSGANALTSDRLSDIGNGPTFCDALVEIALASNATQERPASGELAVATDSYTAPPPHPSGRRSPPTDESSTRCLLSSVAPQNTMP